MATNTLNMRTTFEGTSYSFSYNRTATGSDFLFQTDAVNSTPSALAQGNVGVDRVWLIQVTGATACNLSLDNGTTTHMVLEQDAFVVLHGPVNTPYVSTASGTSTVEYLCIEA